jgi:hypothetical protein
MEMEMPWPKWMEFVIIGASTILCIISLFVIDRFQKPQDD